MKSWGPSLLAVAFFLGGIPHLWCPCGCSVIAVGKAVSQPDSPRCPHCRQGNSSPGPRQPKPCECDDCDQVLAVLPDSATATPTATCQARLDVASEGLHVEDVTPQKRTIPRGPGPPALSSHPSSAVLILLQRFLL